MNGSLRLLIVEDSEDDALLIERLLAKSGYQLHCRRIDSAVALTQALAESEWDLVISDFVMPHFSGYEALAMVKGSGLDIPFIVVSGKIGEETAVEAIKKGANDYILKGQLARLPLAVQRELADVKERKMKSELEATIQQQKSIMQESDERLRLITENLPDCYIYQYTYGSDGVLRYLFVSHSVAQILPMLSVAEILNDASVLLNLLDEDHLVTLQQTEAASASQMKDFMLDVRYRCPDGDWRWLHFSSRPRLDAQGLVTWDGCATDITEAKRSEKRLSSALAEKETLLRELYHRTKNNMAVIQSMLSIQAMKSTNEEVWRIVRETESKIQAMALVHEKLYSNQNLSRIDLLEYLQDLSRTLKASYAPLSDNLNLAIEGEVFSVLMDTAIPFGLVVTELLTNAIKYAYPAGRAGDVCLKLSRISAGLLSLTVVDHGVGLPEGFVIEETESIGLSTVLAIVEHQMGGRIALRNQNGVEWRIEFQDTIYKERIQNEKFDFDSPRGG